MTQDDANGKSLPQQAVSFDAATVARLIDLIRETVETTLTRTLTQVRLQASVTSASPDASSPTSPQKTGIELKPGEQTKAADLRIALLTGKIPDTCGLLIDTKTFARLLSISKAHFYRLQAEEAVPPPIHVGQVKRWRLAEILEWIEADCPPQATSIHMRRGASRRKGH